MNLPIVVTAQELSDAALPQVKIVDLRPPEAYEAGHILNALPLPATLLGRAENGANGLLPDPIGVKLIAKQIGLRDGDHIVAYDQGSATPAARLVWVLHAYGFIKISWLNGGFAAWERAKLPVSTDSVKPETSNIELSFTTGNMLSAEQLMDQLDDENLRIVDVRSTGEYEGTDIRSTRGGRIPKAHHLEWTQAFNELGELKSDEALHALFASHDVSPQNHVSVYCQTHQRSAVTYLVLKHLQYKNVTAVDGAWSNWGNRTDTPIENESAS